MKPRTHARSLLLLSVVGALLGGCASSSYHQADDTSSSLQGTGGSLNKGAAQVDAVLAALDGVVAAKDGDLRKPYDKFSDEVGKTEKVAEGVKRTADNMKANTEARFQEWVAEADKITDPELKQAALARRADAKKHFAKVTETMNAAKAAYDPFISGLKNLKVALGQDLTAGGVNAASPVIQRVKNDGTKLKAAIGDVQAAVTEVKNQLVSPKAPPAK